MYNKQIILILTVALAAGTVLQVIGFLTPGWERFTFLEIVDLKFVNATYSQGIWYYIRCVNSKCKTESFHDKYVTKTGSTKYTLTDNFFMESNYAHVIGNKVVSILSITAAILSNVAALYCILKPQFYQMFAWLIILLTTVSASLIWTMIGRVAAHQGAYLRSPDRPFTFDFPYSLFLHSLGSVVCLTVCVFHLKRVLIFKQSEGSRRYQQFDNHEQNAVTKI